MICLSCVGFFFFVDKKRTSPYEWNILVKDIKQNKINQSITREHLCGVVCCLQSCAISQPNNVLYHTTAAGLAILFDDFDEYNLEEKIYWKTPVCLIHRIGTVHLYSVAGILCGILNLYWRWMLTNHKLWRN